MSELITGEIFTDGQKNINAANMNGIIGLASVQPDVIGNKVASATMDVADQMLVLKTNNTLARARFDTVTNSVASQLPLADSTKNGMLHQLSGLASDYVGGDNQCHPLVPTGTVWDTLASVAPTGWLILDGSAVSRTTYANLFAMIGTAFGAGDGSTTFNLPDARGRVTLGAGTGAGLTNRPILSYVGAETTALVTANLPAHAHTITDVQHTHATVAHNHADAGHTHPVSANAGGTINVTGGGSAINYFSATNTGTGFANLAAAAPNTDARFTGITTTQNIGSGTGHSNMPPSLVVNKMVKF